MAAAQSELRAISARLRSAPAEAMVPVTSEGHHGVIADAFTVFGA